MYKVTAQYAGARELPGEPFKDINQAKAFIEKKIQENAALKVKVIYRLYEWDDLIQEFDSTKTVLTKPSEGTGSSGSSSGKGASFRPTPLNTAPRPPGTPQKWLKDEEDEDDKKK